MIYKIYSSDASTLSRLPETGMGYQIVEASKYAQNDIKRYMVYNSELAVNLDNEFKTYKRIVFTESFSKVLNSSIELMLETKTIKVLNKAEAIHNIRALFNESGKTKKRNSGDRGAKENPKENPTGSEVFVRLSAYENDKRVDLISKRLMAGTYTTTENDYSECVTAKDDPVDRYALPNDELIKWAFYIKPKNIDTLQRGVVQPAYEHEGGGIEAYFENGTSNDTFLLKKVYGE